jgi:hypothetical protein
MSHYEPREKTPEWERMVEAHNAAAEQAAHDEECRIDAGRPCVGHYTEGPDHVAFGVTMRLANEAGLELLEDPIALSRRDEIVAEWRTIR